jgi:plasmid stabilization system protein ParE
VRRIELSRLAETDLDRLEAWLEKNGAPYAADLGVALEDAVTSLGEFPERGRHSGFGELRELVVPFRTWSYVVTYSVTVSRVIIVRIHHGFEDR